MQTDPSTVLKVSAICGASYGAQMGLAADTFEPVYYKSGSGRSASWEWFGHAISGGSLIQAAAASKPSKPVLQAAGVQWLTAPLVMALHTKQGKMKPEMAIANGALCASMGGLCFLAANKCDE